MQSISNVLPGVKGGNPFTLFFSGGIIMRILLLITLCFFSSQAFAQSANFEDGFSDRDISNWTGDTADFVFVTENGNVLLQLQAGTSGTSQLSTPSAGVIGYWEFFIRMDGFSPSNSNKAEIYLMSDHSDLSQPLNGYMLQAGENGSNDVFRLFRITAGERDGEVLTGTTSIASGGEYRVKVIRDAQGNWDLELADAYHGSTVHEASGSDNTYSSTGFFGFRTTYTSTRSDKFYFDFKIQPPPVLPLSVNELNVISDRELHIRFNKAVDGSSVQNSDFLVSPGSKSPSGVQLLSDSLLHLEFTSSFASGENLLMISGIQDMANDTALADTTIRFLRADGLAPGRLLITEIMYDPLADPDDFLPDQSEYIELYNLGPVALSLEGLHLHDAPDENMEADRLYPESDSGKWIPSNGYFLIYAENDTDIFTESRVARYFGLSQEHEKFSMRINRSTLSLSASGDAVFIADSTGTVIDSVFYDESWHNPNRVSTDGVSLEKIRPAGASGNPSNWSSSTEVSGGTPGAQNSVFLESGAAPANAGITFNPNPFSPDGDGYQDFVSINYTLDEPDYLITVRIFDRYGRLVRKLVDSHPAGFEGHLIWDGLTGDRARNRVGIYVVLFDAFNSTNGRNLSFKETVVLARKF